MTEIDDVSVSAKSANHLVDFLLDLFWWEIEMTWVEVSLKSDISSCHFPCFFWCDSPVNPDSIRASSGEFCKRVVAAFWEENNRDDICQFISNPSQIGKCEKSEILRREKSAPAIENLYHIHSSRYLIFQICNCDISDFLEKCMSECWFCETELLRFIERLASFSLDHVTEKGERCTRESDKWDSSFF